jgi:hypothetical protein
MISIQSKTMLCYDLGPKEQIPKDILNIIQHIKEKLYDVVEVTETKDEWCSFDDINTVYIGIDMKQYMKLSDTLLLPYKIFWYIPHGIHKFIIENDKELIIRTFTFTNLECNCDNSKLFDQVDEQFNNMSDKKLEDYKKENKEYGA